MKYRIAPLLLTVILSLLSLGWRRSTPPIPDGLYEPMSMTLAGNKLLVSDRYTGLHIYDVTNLGAPREIRTIPMEYNVSSAVKDDIIYTNDQRQLVALRLTDDSYTVVARIGVKYHDGGPNPIGDDVESFSCFCATGDFATAPTPSPHAGSSYATFAVVDDVLYRVDGSSLLVYDITTPEKPSRSSSLEVGWDIETLHPSQSLLFIGGRQGMYIFDREDALHPNQIAKIQHARACDPVVVSGSTAFVTLRGGNSCGQSPDELLCVNIKDPHKPGIIGQLGMKTPYGLAVHNSRLYVSHGSSGYSLLSVASPTQPRIEKTWSGESTRDFIWSGNTLFVLSEDNVSIYDVTEPLVPRLLSKVEPESSS